VVNILSIPEFVAKAKELPVLDVRAPKEYIAGHIPGAVSFPIFSDDERATVGTAYKKQGHDPAVLIGLDLFGPRMSAFVKTAKKLAINNELLVHCWRGGMRSNAMAWLLDFSGFKVHLLEGGYKTFRHLMLNEFSKPRPIILIGGMTGTGKTDILPHLLKLDQQVIDLEGIANHKGSAFGAIGLPPQPSTEHFENILGMELFSFAIQHPVWLEDEDITIGRVVLPKPLFTQMQEAPTIILEAPKSLRIKKLAEEYCRTDAALLEEAILKISKRLGGLASQQALDAIAAGDMEQMVDIALSYYDKAYTYKLNEKQRTYKLKLGNLNPAENAQQVLQLAKQHKLL
jgi:tRNA 2-selenouridine synthase